MSIATGGRYEIEKVDPSEVARMGPEIVRCEDFASLKTAWEDLAQRGPFDAHEEARSLKSGEVSELHEVDRETGVEVTARRA